MDSYVEYPLANLLKSKRLATTTQPIGRAMPSQARYAAALDPNLSSESVPVASASLTASMGNALRKSSNVVVERTRADHRRVQKWLKWPSNDDVSSQSATH